MKSKLMLLFVTAMAYSICSYANTGGDKNRKEDPDMNGVIILSENGKPLKDVSITAYNAAKKEKTTISDANGMFNMIDLKPGTYKFVFEKDGFKKVVRDKIVLKTNEDYQLTIEMKEDEEVFDLMPSPLRFVGTR